MPRFGFQLKRTEQFLPAVALLFCFLAATFPVRAQTNFATLATDGGWCWFSDPRALFHNGTLFFGCVRSDGHSVLNEFNLQSGTMTNLWASSLTEFDDHDVCGMQVREDGTIYASWARHGGDQFFSYRISTSTNPVTTADWGVEHQIAPSGAGVTYCNPYQLSAESGKLYSFSRDLNYNPTVFTSSDDGATWSGPTLMVKTGTGSTRPYVKYCSNYTNRIDVLYTDAHPDNYTTSLYEMYYQGGAFYQTDGTFLTNFSQLPILHDLGQHGSVVYQYNAAATVDPNQWIATARAWCWEIAYQTNGAPVCVFQTKVDNVTGTTWADARIYYYYAWWTGTNWQKRFIAQAGRPLYNGQPDYGGGIGIDPVNPNVIYISSDAANPFDLSTTTSVPLGAHYEIYKGITADGGMTFTWSAVTTNSAVDNCRPYIPRRFGGEPCVLWWRGTYNAYTSFYTSIVGMFTTAVPVVTNTGGLPVPAAVPPAPILKANNSTSLNQGTSWVGGTAPGAGNVAVWDSTVTAANTVALGANTSWAGILVTNPGGAVNISAGNTLTLGASGIDLSGATANLTISSSLALGGGDQAWNVTNGRVLTLNTGTFTRSNGATLNIQGAGTVAASMTGLSSTDNSSPAPGIIGSWATVGTGTSARYATISGGSVAAFTGFVSAFNWSTTTPNFTNFEISAVSAAIGIDRMCNTIRWTGGTATENYGSGTSTNRLFVRGILNASAGTLSFVKASGAPTFVPGTNAASNHPELVLNAAAGSLVMGVPITDNAGVAATVVVTGSGTNTVALTAPNTYTGGTILNAGELTVGNATALGGASAALTVNGGVLDLGNFSPSLGAATITGGIIQDGTLTATSFTANNANSAGVSAVLAGASTALVKNGPGILSLTAANTYGGLTSINAGTLNCLGGISGAVSVNTGTLSGNGTIGGAVTNQTGGLIAPGADAASFGTLNMNGTLTLQPGSTILIKLGRKEDGVVNDAVTGLTSLFCGGTILVTNIGVNALTAGDTLQIFSASNYAGAFANVLLPGLGTNLYWTNNLAVNGTVTVMSSVSTASTNLIWNVTGTNMQLSWPGDHIGWRLQVQTNTLNVGLGTNWTDVAGSSLTNVVIIPMNMTQGGEFYRLIY